MLVSKIQIVSKMHYFRNNFLKIAKRLGTFRPLVSLGL